MPDFEAIHLLPKQYIQYVRQRASAQSAGLAQSESHERRKLRVIEARPHILIAILIPEGWLFQRIHDQALCEESAQELVQRAVEVVLGTRVSGPK